MRLFFLYGRTFERLPFIMYQHFAIGGGHRRGTDAPQGLFAQRLAAFPFSAEGSLNAYIVGAAAQHMSRDTRQPTKYAQNARSI